MKTKQVKALVKEIIYYETVVEVPVDCENEKDYVDSILCDTDFRKNEAHYEWEVTKITDLTNN